MRRYIISIPRGFAWIALVLSFVPILFPVVLLLAFLAILGVGLLMADRPGSLTPRGMAAYVRHLLAGEGRPILSKAILAVVISLSLYSVLWIHSQVFYVSPLKRDQEPFRQDAAEQLRETEVTPNRNNLPIEQQPR